MKILIIEDEPKVAAFIRKGLEENFFQVTVAYDGEMGKRMALQNDFDVLVIDLMLPLINGLELCRQLRQEKIVTPILILTALGTLEDKVMGLETGADDYLVKPFHFKELLARLKALVRRSSLTAPKPSVLKFSDIVLDSFTKTASRDGQEIILTAKEYALLELFILNNKRVLSRSFIAERIWNADFDPNSNIIDVYVNYVRNKIEKGFNGKLIHTVVGMGYIMKEE